MARELEEVASPHPNPLPLPLGYTGKVTRGIPD